MAASADSQTTANTSSEITSSGATTKSEAPSTGAYIPPSMRTRVQAEQSKPTEAAPSTTSKYVPPSMRNKTSESSSAYEIPTTSVNYRRPNKSQPNINDCLEFPTLDAAGVEIDKQSAQTGSEK